MTVPQEGWTMKDGTPWPGNNTSDHPGMIQILLAHTGGLDVHGNELPCLVYASREKRPGFQHHSKAGAMNALVNFSCPRLYFLILINQSKMVENHYYFFPEFPASCIFSAKQCSFCAELGLQSLCE